MISKNQIESILKLNGVEPSSPDDLIRSVLMSARYDDDEIDTALLVLRQNIKTNQTRLDGLHKVFRTDQALRPDEISHLLGVEFDFTESMVPQSHERKLTRTNYITIVVLSMVTATSVVMIYMYLQKIGIFHHSIVW